MFLLLIILFINPISTLTTFNIGGFFPADDEKSSIFESETANFNSEVPDLVLAPIIKFESSLSDPIITLKSTCHLLAEGIVAIFSSAQHSNDVEAVRSLCDNKEIPLFETGWDLDPPRSSSVVNLYPYQKVLTEGYIQVVEALGWKEFAVLYQDDDSLMRVGRLLEMMNGVEKRKVMVIQMVDEGEDLGFRNSLKAAWKSGHVNFVLDCSFLVLEQILIEAQQVGLITNQFKFFITNLDFHTLDLNSYKHSQTNITGIRLYDPNSEIYSQKLSKLQEQKEKLAETIFRLEAVLLIDALTILEQILPEIESYEPKALICNTTDYWDHGYSIINTIKTSTYNGLSGEIKFDEQGFRTEFEMELIELREFGVEVIGKWSQKNGVTVTRKNLETEEETESLRNKTFRVITCLTDPYGMLKKSEVTLYGNEQYEGFGIDLIDELAKMEGFNYTFIIREDKKNGAKDEKTGEWSGMIGDVRSGKADLAITDLTITSEREEAVDFTPPFMNLGISILYTKPTKAPPEFFSFAAPFGLEVWLSLSGAYFIVSITLFVAGRLSNEEWTNPFPCIEEPEFLVNQFSLRNSFWFTIGSLMQQGTEIAPIAVSTRMIAGLWWFFTLIMVSSYTANLAAFLTTENPDAHFTNVQELVERAEEMKITYGVKSGGATYLFFKQSHDPLYKRIAEYLDNHPEAMVDDNKQGVERAQKGMYAFFMESTSIEYETERKCDLAQVGNPLDDKGYGIAMRKNSYYRKALSTAMLKLQSNGKVRELKTRWWQERHGGGACSGEEAEAAAVPLNLKSVEGVFYVTVGGIVLASLMVVVEMLLHNLKLSLRKGLPFGESVKEDARFYMKFGENVKPVMRSRSKSENRKSQETFGCNGVELKIEEFN